MNYKEMSDKDLSFQVAKLRYADKVAWIDTCGRVMIREQIAEDFEFDPCNNPSDAWPIIVENKIGVWTHPTFAPLWSARLNIESDSDKALDGVLKYFLHQDKNPLRAAMIVYLMMQETK